MNKEANGRAPVERDVRLLPCPFCGESVKIECVIKDDCWNPPRPTRFFFIQCCAQMEVQSSNWFDSFPPPENEKDECARNELIESWNKRTPNAELTGPQQRKKNYEN